MGWRNNGVSEQWDVGLMACRNNGKSHYFDTQICRNSGRIAISTSHFSDKLSDLSEYRHVEPMRRRKDGPTPLNVRLMWIEKLLSIQYGKVGNNSTNI